MNPFIKDNWFRIGILVAIVVSGYFVYMSQVNKQESIERQQQIELRAKAEQLNKEDEQSNKEYVANQKKACLSIYETEGDKYNNVRSWNYNSSTDKCEITYNLKASEKKSKSECEKNYDESKEIWKGQTIPSFVFSDYFNCLDGTFVKIF